VLASAWMLTWTMVLRRRESALGLLTVLAGALFYQWKLRKTAPRSSHLEPEKTP